MSLRRILPSLALPLLTVLACQDKQPADAGKTDTGKTDATGRLKVDGQDP